LGGQIKIWINLLFVLGLFCANSTTFAKILEKFGQIFKTTKLVLKKEKKKRVVNLKRLLKFISDAPAWLHTA
jgi:hypothetical protein